MMEDNQLCMYGSQTNERTERSY